MEVLEIPGYKIERELGRGGMATVYLAVQSSVERRVALKIMSPVLLVDPAFTERFTREARIAANLYHPHIVPVHDVGVHDEQPYIAMEYLAGGDLAARLGARKVDLPFAVRVVREIAAALDYAHRKGFVHRDVKPENVLFRDDLTAVLTDFGIARAVNSATQMTRTGAVVGTPQYMSPEQARGRELDGRSDLYGLGIVFHELLTGEVPYRGNDSVAVGIMHVTEPVPRLPAHLDFIQPILDRFLAKDPEDRYQSGAEAVSQLEALEARVITGQSPRVEVATPKPRGRPPADTTPLPLRDLPDGPVGRGGKAVGADGGTRLARVGATPRPDGSLRQEPTLGSLEDLSSFDRTVTRPAFTALAGGPPPGRGAATTSRRRRRRPAASALLLFVLLAAATGAAWWYRDALLALMPNPEVGRLLERARAAYEYQHYYGDSQQYANRLYERVLALDPGNAQARAGLDLLAETFLRRFDAAVADGDFAAAREALARARELAPELPAVRAARGRLERVLVPTAPEADGAGAAPGEAARLVDEGRDLLERGRLVGRGKDNALARFEAALAIDPADPRAREGLAAVEGALGERFDAALGAGRLEAAEDALAALAPMLDTARRDALEARLGEARRLRAEAAARARLDALLAEADAQLAADRLTRPPGDNALATYREAAELAAGLGGPEPRPAAGITRVAERLLLLTEVALEQDQLERAERQLDLIGELRPGLPGLERARNRLVLYRQQRRPRELTGGEAARLAGFLAAADEAMAKGQLMAPPGSSAYDALKAALTIAPNDPQVQAGLARLAERLLAEARQALAGGDLGVATSRLADARQTDPFRPGLGELRRSLAAAYRAETRAAIEAGRLDTAQETLLRAIELAPDHEDVPALELALSIARDSTG